MIPDNGPLVKEHEGVRRVATTIRGDGWNMDTPMAGVTGVDDEGCPCPAPRRERRDAAEHRQRILAVARSLFGARGVDGVTMRQVARASGVGQGTLYRRYAHKGLLCMDLLGDSIARLQADIEEAPAAASALAGLDALLARLIAFNEENGPLLAAVVDAACGDRRASMYRGPFYSWLRATVAGLLERAAATGECGPLDAPYTADAILAALAIDLYTYQRHEQGYTPARIAGAIRRLYVDGLRAAP